ncbi:MAG: ABC transporter permease [Lachnospiraceae bacterium]|nr:ABC transporter permease [Lachnospiraceae bacterium]
MMTMNQLDRKLQKADRKQSLLYLFCNFISLLLITAYAAMMFSPTVLEVLPEGGDSRKQMTMIFVLALFGCVVFTVYASSLFFRKKSRQLGTLMALGASRKRLAPGLFREVLALSSCSSLLGIAAGFPFVFLLWNGFRLFIVESDEMHLRLDFRCLLLSAVFFVIVVAFSCLTAYRYLKRTNIIDVVQEEHKNEPVREPGRWCGPVGIVLIFAGAVCGYEAPAVYMELFSAYPTGLLNLLYAPVFVGLYMVILHTVVHGWIGKRKHPYKNIISRSMMKFQGKQTVNNLLVSTVLIAGSAFAIFYIPMLGVGQMLDVNSRPFDYCYHYRMDQTIPGQEEIAELASQHGLSIKDFRDCPYLILGMDAIVRREEGRRFHEEHVDLSHSVKVFSESGFYALTGEKISVAAGEYRIVSTSNESDIYLYTDTGTFLTNMVTRDTIDVKFAGYAHYDFLAGPPGYLVISNTDYETIAHGLTPDWLGTTAFFNIDGEDSYAFAQDFFYTLVSSFGPECEHGYYYDRVEKYAADEAGEVYWGDTPRLSKLSFDNPDASDFRIYWAYMPKIRILDRNDFLRSFAVYLMMFLFISIICTLAALIISYTRCMTIALNNRYVFDDLRRLGAPPSFLVREVKSQVGTVFRMPSIVGMTMMYLLYALLMLGNDGQLVSGEIGGLAVCLVILLLIAGIFYVVYRYTVRKMCGELGI